MGDRLFKLARGRRQWKNGIALVNKNSQSCEVEWDVPEAMVAERVSRRYERRRMEKTKLEP